MRWSVDTAEVRSARKGRHTVFQLLNVSKIPDWDAGGTKEGMKRKTPAKDSFDSESACAVLASFHV